MFFSSVIWGVAFFLPCFSFMFWDGVGFFKVCPTRAPQLVFSFFLGFFFFQMPVAVSNFFNDRFSMYFPPPIPLPLAPIFVFPVRFSLPGSVLSLKPLPVFIASFRSEKFHLLRFFPPISSFSLPPLRQLT